MLVHLANYFDGRHSLNKFCCALKITNFVSFFRVICCKGIFRPKMGSNKQLKLFLVLEDGSSFTGYSFGAPVEAHGEVGLLFLCLFVCIYTLTIIICIVWESW